MTGVPALATATTTSKYSVLQTRRTGLGCWDVVTPVQTPLTSRNFMTHPQYSVHVVLRTIGNTTTRQTQRGIQPSTSTVMHLHHGGAAIVHAKIKYSNKHIIYHQHHCPPSVSDVIKKHHILSHSLIPECNQNGVPSADMSPPTPCKKKS